MHRPDGTSRGKPRRGLPTAINTPEIRFPHAGTRKFAAVESVKEHLAHRAGQISAIDGVRVTTPEERWLLRASHTEAVLVARCEARGQAGLRCVARDLRDTLEKAGIPAPSL